MKKIVLLLSLVLGLGLSSLALALTLDEAKTQGLVGEKVDGFIIALETNPDAGVQALISSTNTGRLEVYNDLAKRNNITAEAVGILSAEKLRANAKKGEYIQQPTLQWQRKP